MLFVCVPTVYHKENTEICTSNSSFDISGKRLLRRSTFIMIVIYCSSVLCRVFFLCLIAAKSERSFKLSTKDLEEGESKRRLVHKENKLQVTPKLNKYKSINTIMISAFFSIPVSMSPSSLSPIPLHSAHQGVGGGQVQLQFVGGTEVFKYFSSTSVNSDFFSLLN